MLARFGFCFCFFKSVISYWPSVIDPKFESSVSRLFCASVCFKAFAVSVFSECFKCESPFQIQSRIPISNSNLIAISWWFVNCRRICICLGPVKFSSCSQSFNFFVACQFQYISRCVHSSCARASKMHVEFPVSVTSKIASGL